MAAIGRSAPAVAVDSPSGLSTSTSSASRLGPRPSAVATAPELHLTPSTLRKMFTRLFTRFSRDSQPRLRIL